MVVKMRIEQTPDTKFRIEYDPVTDEFRTTQYKYLLYERGVDCYYGWFVGTGTPPDPHLDVLLISDRKYDVGDTAACKIIGYYQRNDGDHKLLSVDPLSKVNDIAELPQEVYQSLLQIYGDEYEGEAWIGRESADQVYTSFVKKK